MHIGIEVKKDNVHIVYVSGGKQTLSATKEFKLHIDGESVKSLVDFRKNLQMLFVEEKINQVSLVEGNSDSSKMRVRIEFLIAEICFHLDIPLNTFSSPHLKNLKDKTFESSMGQKFKCYYKRFGLHVYSENSFAVAWRFS